MSDYFAFEPWKGIQADSGRWYKAVEFLGVGGSCAAFLVLSTTEPTAGLLYAINVFRRLSKPERRSRFLAAARFLKACDHPAIMRVFDEGTYYDQNPFIVVEYLPQTLADSMRAEPGILDKIAYSLQLISALNYLACQDPPVVHRDIKPRNIFIKGGACVLGDFGLMKRLDEGDEEDVAVLSESVGPKMPLYYRTPDLVAYLNDGVPLTPKTDVFQLGLVLAQLFTGRNPQKPTPDFRAPVELEPLGDIPSALSGSIAALIKRMLKLNVDERPFAHDLIGGWQGLFEEAVNQAHKIENRVF